MKKAKTRAVSFLMKSSSAIVVVLLLGIIIYVLALGIPELKPSLFQWNYNSTNVSMMGSIINTLLMIVLSLAIAVPFGVGAAIYLTQYKKKGFAVTLIRLTGETLSGIPSIVYGLFGNIFFSSFCGLGYSLLSGALTMALMILPLVLRTSEEAFLSLPLGLTESSLALGAGKIRTISKVLLPSAMPGIAAGIILGMGRVLGESAALIYTSGTAVGVARSLMSPARTLSVHMYALTSEGLHMEEARATAAVLMVLVLALNFLSNKISRRLGGKR
ncbi:MAG: phosphate ABC transporter permease PstA [Candidatus Ornithospirochaeta sp.]